MFLLQTGDERVTLLCVLGEPYSMEVRSYGCGQYQVAGAYWHGRTAHLYHIPISYTSIRTHSRVPLVLRSLSDSQFTLTIFPAHNLPRFGRAVCFCKSSVCRLVCFVPGVSGKCLLRFLCDRKRENVGRRVTANFSFDNKVCA